MNSRPNALRKPVVMLKGVVAALLGTLAGLAAIAASGADRIVSTSGALTEIVYLLEAESRLVGVDTTSLWPSEAQTLPSVGYQRQLSAEGILALGPDLVLATADAGPPEVIALLDAAGVTIERFPRDFTIDGVAHRIRRTAELMGLRASGEALAESVRQEFMSARAAVATLPVTRRALFLLASGSGSPMVSGRDTAADAVLNFAGLDNVFGDIHGYKPASTEALLGAAPDIVLVLDHGGGHDVTNTEIIERVLAIPGMSDTPAGRNRHIVPVDGAALLSFGPRIGSALHALLQRINDLDA